MYKVFQVVKGALVKGTAPPNSLVTAQTLVQTNQNTQFVYKATAFADMNGAYQMTVPYANTGNTIKTGAITSYRISAPGNRQTFDVSDNDVINGNTITVNLQ